MVKSIPFSRPLGWHQGWVLDVSPSNQSKSQVFSSLDLRYGMDWGCMEPWELLTSPLDHKKKSLPENGANIQKAGGEMERKPDFRLPDVNAQKSFVWKQFFRMMWFQLHESVTTLSYLAQFDSSVLLPPTKNILTDACEMTLSYGCLPLDRLQCANDPLTRFPEQNLLFSMEPGQCKSQGFSHEPWLECSVVTSEPGTTLGFWASQ